MALALFGVILSLAVLVTLAYRGHSVVVVAPLAAMIAVVFSGAPIMGTYTQIFMPALANFIGRFFPLFFFGAIFGYLMTTTGLARYFARALTSVFGPKRAILSIALATALLTYGGVSVWVVAFTIVPMAAALFKESGIPKRLMPSAIAVGSFTFVIAVLPGSPQIHNAIPTSYFGTDIYAAPVFGIISSLIMFGTGLAWLEYRVRQLHARGEYYEPLDAQGNIIDTPEFSPANVPDEGIKDESENLGGPELPHRPAGATATVTRTEPSLAMQGFLGLLPIAIVVAVNFSFTYVFSKMLDTSYLETEQFGSTSLQALLGTWSPTLALAVAVLAIMAMYPKKIKETFAGLSEGAKNAILPCFTTASEVGYGAVIASLAVFTVVKNSMLDVSDNALVVSTVSTAVISGITGSSSGGLSITLQALGDQLAELAAAQGISMEFMHRVTAMASISFDSLPHNGAILTLLIVCGMTHRLAYKDIAVVTVIIPLVTLAAMVGVYTVIPGLG